MSRPPRRHAAAGPDDGRRARRVRLEPEHRSRRRVDGRVRAGDPHRVDGDGDEHGAGAPGAGAARHPARADRQLHLAAARGRAARRPPARVRRRAGRADHGRPRRAQAGDARSWTSARSSRPAASRACCRWPSRPTTPAAGASTSTTPTARPSSGSSSTAARPTTARTRAARGWCCGWRTPSPTTTAGRWSLGPAGSCTWARATAAVPTTSTARAATGSRCPRCWARSCASIRRPRAASPTGSRARTRSQGARARAARSTPTACATRGASRSTGPRTT